MNESNAHVQLAELAVAPASDASTSSEASAARGPEAASASDSLLARVVFPDAAASPTLIPIYVRSGPSAQTPSTEGLTVTGRCTLEIEQGTLVTFDSFFNAFPAAHWRRWTGLTSVVLEVEIDGDARLEVYRSGGNGRVTHERGQTLTSGAPQRIELPVAGRFSDGGSYWFSLRAQTDVTLLGARWLSAEPVTVPGASIGICTFNRVDDCLATIRRLIDDADSVRHVREVIVVDQGTKLVTDHPDFAEAERRWEGRLRVVRQPNLGGSGGFSRAMYEVLADETLGDVILTDDDISPEPESFHRAMMFAAASGGKVLVHGHMLDLWAETRLHNTGDLVDRRSFRTVAAAGDMQDIELTDTNLTNEPAFSKRYEADFGGWWMCLIPRQVMAKVGLAMPVFIKWDDVEYGLRARDAGHPTVSLPGVAVWHQPFYLKDVQTDWTAYFEGRNRLLTAVVHGTPHQVRATVRENLRTVAKNFLTMNYSAVALNTMAVDDVLKGPGFIRDDIGSVMQRVRETRGAFNDALVVSALPDDFVSTVSPVVLEELTRPAATRSRGVLKIARAAASTVRRAGSRGADPRTADLSGRNPHWAVLARLDSAVVATADGSGVTVRVRDNVTMRSQWRAAVAAHLRLLRDVETVQATYRSQFDEWVSPESWKRIFG